MGRLAEPAQMGREPVEVGIVEGALEITLCRPARKNALSRRVLRHLCDALRDHRGHEQLRAVIVGGAGDCFSSGADLDDLDGTLGDLTFDAAMEEAVEAIRSFPLPVIAAIEGPCVGAAFDLAMSCDLRVAAATAFFAVPATRLSLLYNPRSVLRLQRVVRPDTLARLFLIGDRIAAGEAEAAGLASLVVSPGAALARARELAHRAGPNARDAVAATKGLLRAAQDGEVDPAAWEDIRRRLLASPGRLAAIARAKTERGAGKGGNGKE